MCEVQLLDSLSGENGDDFVQTEIKSILHEKNAIQELPGKLVELGKKPIMNMAHHPPIVKKLMCVSFCWPVTCSFVVVLCN